MTSREEEARAAARAIFSRERLGLLVAGGPILALLFAAGWGWLSAIVTDSWPIGMILSGFLAGLTVRLLGRGSRPVFYFASLVLYLATILFAVLLFDVIGQSFVSMKLLIVVMGIGTSAALGLVSFGMSREERWALRDNRGFQKPEEPQGALVGTILPVGALLSGCVALGLVGGGLISGSLGLRGAREDLDEGPIFGEPSIEYWEKQLERDAELAEEARRNGVGLGLSGSDDACHSAVAERHADCELNLCKAQRPYVLAGCLETAKAVREDTPIKW